MPHGMRMLRELCAQLTWHTLASQNMRTTSDLLLPEGQGSCTASLDDRLSGKAGDRGGSFTRSAMGAARRVSASDRPVRPSLRTVPVSLGSLASVASCSSSESPRRRSTDSPRQTSLPPIEKQHSTIGPLVSAQRRPRQMRASSIRDPSDLTPRGGRVTIEVRIAQLQPRTHARNSLPRGAGAQIDRRVEHWQRRRHRRRQLGRRHPRLVPPAVRRGRARLLLLDVLLGVIWWLLPPLVAAERQGASARRRSRSARSRKPSAAPPYRMRR